MIARWLEETVPYRDQTTSAPLQRLMPCSIGVQWSAQSTSSDLPGVASLKFPCSQLEAVPPPTSNINSFWCLTNAQGNKLPISSLPKFVKKIDEVPEISLPLNQPMHIVVSLVYRALFGQFIRLCHSPWTTDKWVQKKWRPMTSNNVTSYPVWRGFFLLDFISKDDPDLIFRNGPYFMWPQGLYLNWWLPNFDLVIVIPKAILV